MTNEKLKNLRAELQEYIDENFLEELEESVDDIVLSSAPIDEEKICEETVTEERPVTRKKFAPRSALQKNLSANVRVPNILGVVVNFRELFNSEKSETFSDMLIRLIRESGEKNSAIYSRANIDRRHFSKICSHENYQPTKSTALAFAVSLKLNFEKTQELLATAGYTLTNSNLADVIVEFFIKREIFDINLLNQYLYDYNQPLLGG